MTTPAARRREKNILRIWNNYQNRMKKINGQVNPLERHGRITQEELLLFTSYCLFNHDTLPRYKISTVRLYLDLLMNYIVRNKIECQPTSPKELRDAARRHIQGNKSTLLAAQRVT